jgi:hypothetical protein
MRLAALSLLGTFALASCYRDFNYVPATSSNAVVAGIPAVDYPIPPDAPTGDIRLATLGVADVHPTDAPNGIAKAIHLRMIATNKGPDDWTIDAREQRLVIAGAVQVRAGDAFPDRKTDPPIVHVGPGKKETVDLFFLLPQTLEKGPNRPELDVLWTVHTPTRTIEQRTSFDRLRSEPAYDGPSDGNGGWGGSSSPSR